MPEATFFENIAIRKAAFRPKYPRDLRSEYKSPQIIYTQQLFLRSNLNVVNWPKKHMQLVPYLNEAFEPDWEERLKKTPAILTCCLKNVSLIYIFISQWEKKTN